MKLFYYQRPDGIQNFGDRLNLWLWERLLPGILDEDGSVAFVGIGTLLNNLLPRKLAAARQIVVFSTGAGYERRMPALGDRWRIYCVRGPLSARILGLPAEAGVADGALLLRRIFQPNSEKNHRFAFMPHVHHARYGDGVWQEICDRIGFLYIDPRWDIEPVLDAISQSEVVLAEAMHGAIAAEALRVPWIPIRTSARILSFKWQDWCASLELPYQPMYVSPPAGCYPPLAKGVRSALQAGAHWGQWLQQEHLRSLQGCGQEAIARQLLRIAQQTRPMLSAEATVERLTAELETRLHQFHTDAIAGKFDGAQARQSEANALGGISPATVKCSLPLDVSQTV